MANGGGDVQMDYLKRKEQLDLKEKELAAREEELKKQQEELVKAGALKPKKNWPKCFPITHHDIDGEVRLTSWHLLICLFDPSRCTLPMLTECRQSPQRTGFYECI